jgi:hypothetical protein
MDGIKFTVAVDDSKLQDKILQMSLATGKTVREQSRVVMKGLITYVLQYTPPASAQAQGKAAQQAGEGAISRDLRKLFVPVTLKHKRPEKWPDVHALHHEAFQSGKITTPPVRYHVDKAKLSALRNVLKTEVGLLASGWVPGAITLGVAVPAWILRHSGSGRGTNLQEIQTETRITLKVTNHMPATAGVIAAQTQRLIDSAKRAQINGMVRQLPYILKRNLAGTSI